MKASKVKICTLSLLWAAAGLTATAQVGVNTTQPEGAFHVKAGSNNDKDVVVKDGTGNVGIHTTTPQAKLEVVGSKPGIVQIIDGLQAEGNILTSDADGNARWATPLGSAGKLEAVLELGAQDIAAGNSVDVPTSHFSVKADGYHVYEIRWYATYASAPGRQVYTATHLQLILRSAATGVETVADEFEMYHDITTTAGDAVTFWMSLSTQAKAGDELSLIVRPSAAHATLQLRKTSKLTTSKVIVKRLNVQ
jgi:hypothetical protein